MRVFDLPKDLWYSAVCSLREIGRKQNKKPPNCSSDGFVLVGDERIELPQVESESTALPLCKSPIFCSCLAVLAAQRVLLYPQMRRLSSLFLKKVALFWQPTQQRKSFLHSNDKPAHRRTEESGPWAGVAFIRAYCSRNRPARFPVRRGRADTAGASSGAGTAADSPALQSGRPEAAPRPCPPGCG